MGDTGAQALIDAIVANPDDLRPWIIYADWLRARGDLRGELISLEVAREAGNLDPAVTDRIGELDRQEEHLLSPALAARAHLWKFAFRRGFIHDARCLIGAEDDRADASAVAALVADPHAALLAAVDVWDLWEPLLAAPLRSLRSLTVTDLGAGAPRLEDRLPRLDTLVLEGDISVATLNHRALRRLVTSEQACRAITTGAFQLPNLEEMLVDLSANLEDDGEAVFDGALLWRPPPRLKLLGFVGRFDVPTLAECPLLAQLTRLSLDRVTLDDLDAILVHARGFRRVARLQLALYTPDRDKRLDPSALAQLRDRFAVALPATTVDANWSQLEADYEATIVDANGRDPTFFRRRRSA